MNRRNKWQVRVIVKNWGGYEILNEVYEVDDNNNAVAEALYKVSLNDGDTITIEEIDD